MTQCPAKGYTSTSDDKEKASVVVRKDEAERTAEQKLHKLTLLTKET